MLYRALFLPTRQEKKPPQSTFSATKTVQSILRHKEVSKNPIMIRRGSDLTLSVAEGTVALDGAHLSAAIAELVANAFIFSKPGEPVTVTGVAHPGRYQIEVADLGPGMSPEQCARVGAFQQFGRAQQNQQGLGLGLAIARAAAEIAGGQFLVQAGADGRGLHVTLDLPRFGRGITGREVSGPEYWDTGGE
jgi:signal transduction histidine kinase